MALQVEIKEGIDARKYFPDTKHIIEYVFTIGKKHYFKFSDHLNIPYERGLSCLVYYRELEMNIDREFLQEHLEAIKKILHTNPIDIFRINNLNEQLLTRLSLPKDPELMYKLASVVFFDQDESPIVYEYEYGKKKIQYWKENTTVHDFFLQKPLKGLIPYLEFAGENLETFSRMMTDVNKAHSDNLYHRSLASSKMKLNGKKDSSPAATPQN
jgi:hypothetical protein